MNISKDNVFTKEIPKLDGFMCRDILYLTVHRQLCESGSTHADVRCATAGGKPL